MTSTSTSSPATTRARGVRDLLWLLRRRPLACARDLARRRRWAREEWARPLRALAPARAAHHRARRRAPARALRRRRGAGRDAPRRAHGAHVQRHRARLRHLPDAAQPAREARAARTRSSPAVTTTSSTCAASCRRRTCTRSSWASTSRRSSAARRCRRVARCWRSAASSRRRASTCCSTRSRGCPACGCGSSATARCARSSRRRRRRCGGRVELLGSRAPAEVRAELERADVLAMPCVVARDGDRDSMPVVVKEAMAMGLLVVASDEVGLPECVLAPWGFLAPPGDADALAEQLRAALALDPGAAAAGRAAARAWVRANTDVDGETARMAAVIEALRECARPSGLGRRRRRCDEHPQARAERDRPPAGVHRPALLARRLRRIEAAADDEHVEAAVAQRLLEARQRCGTGSGSRRRTRRRTRRRCRSAFRRRARPATGRRPTSRSPGRCACPPARRAAACRPRGRCRDSARR